MTYRKIVEKEVVGNERNNNFSSFINISFLKKEKIIITIKYWNTPKMVGRMILSTLQFSYCEVSTENKREPIIFNMQINVLICYCNIMQYLHVHIYTYKLAIHMELTCIYGKYVPVTCFFRRIIFQAVGDPFPGIALVVRLFRPQRA